MRSALALVAGAIALAGCWSAATTLRAERPLLDAGTGAGDDAHPPASAGDGGRLGDDAAGDATGLEDVGQGDGGADVDACVLVQHTDGLGQTFQDCVPLGTYDQQLALDACRAFVGGACTMGGACGDTNYMSGLDGGAYGSWGYTGAGAGHVSTARACPTNSDPTYK